VVATPARPVLLYDGVCGFCDRTVRLLLRIDRRGAFRFAPLDGDFATRVFDARPTLHGIDSLILVEVAGDDSVAGVFTRSDALLRIAAHLGGAWRLVGVARAIPGALRDRAYDSFARRRYRLMGRLDACRVPPAELRSRFLS